MKSFNFDGWDQHLANQWYSICVRMEAGFCAIKYEECDPEKGTFRISRDDSKYRINENDEPTLLPHDLFH